VSFQLEFHPDVQAETDEAYRWYELRRVGLGSDFLDAVEQVLKEIQTNPARYGFAAGDIREGLLTRFPYAVYYRVLTNHIRVLSILHTSQNPAEWQSRS
jgi:plasmid stabilization system protein ParE